MTLPGYAGQILFVDLTSGRIRKEPLDPGQARSFLGGHGMNYRLAYDIIPPQAAPLSAENAIIIGTGPFSGTLVPGSSELTITSKLPLSGGFATNSGGGAFSMMLKSSGFDHVVITGIAPRPVYLKIEEGAAQLCNAADLWGRDSYDTVDELRKRYEPCSVIPIGPAGEHLVKVSVTQIDKGGTVGFGGLPAVMGSKNLKAIVAVRGSKPLRVANPRRLTKAVDEMMQRVHSYAMRPALLDGGTMSMTVEWMESLGRAARNWTEYAPPPANPMTLVYRGGWRISQIDEVHRKARRTIACPTCPMGDKDLCFVTEGEFAPMRGYMTDFMGQGGYGGKTAVDDRNRGVKLMDSLNRYNICHFNFHNVFDLMLYLYQEGIITKGDTGGIELGEDYQLVLELARMTAFREGLGGLLADGALEAARRIGRGAEKHAVHIKGCAPYFDARVATLDNMCFGQLVYPGRTHYAPSGVGIYMLSRPVSQFLMHANRIGIPEEAQKRIFTASDFNSARLAKHAQDWFSLFDCLGQCHRLYIHRFHNLKGFTQLYSAITGVEISEQELLRAGERVWNMYKALNTRAGFSRKDDRAPEAWFTPLKGRDGREYPMMDYYRSRVLGRQDVEQMLDDYYDERGWERETGAPTQEKLNQLGLGWMELHPLRGPTSGERKGASG